MASKTAAIHPSTQEQYTTIDKEAMLEQDVVSETPLLEHTKTITPPSKDASAPQNKMVSQLPETIFQKIGQDSSTAYFKQ